MKARIGGRCMQALAIAACFVTLLGILAGCGKTTNVAPVPTETTNVAPVPTETTETTTSAVVAAIDKPYYPESQGYLLRDYPKDVVPLYMSARIRSCEFVTESEPEPSWDVSEGQPYCFYRVLYETEEDPDDVKDHYASLMDEVAESDPRYEGTVRGSVGQFRVLVMANRPPGASTQVVVHVTPAQSDTPLTNPYFAGFPEGLVDGWPGSHVRADSFGVSAITGKVWYSRSFSPPTPEVEEFKTYYTDRYGTRDAFNSEGVIQWKEQEHDVVVSFDSVGVIVEIYQNLPAD